MNDIPKSIGHAKFKDGPLGKIPEEWKISRLNYICDIKGRIGWRGYTVEDLRKSGPLVIGGTQIISNHKLNLSDPVFISEEKYNESPEIQIKKNDIILVKTGNTIGKTAIIEYDIGKATINPNTIILRCKNELSKYIYYYLTNTNFQQDIWNLVGVGAQPSVNQTNLGNLQIPIPPFIEQKKITAILSSVDKVIEKTESLINKLKDLKKAMMQELLTKGIGHTKFKNSPLGKIPEEWEIKKLDDLRDKNDTYSLTGGPFGSDLKSEHYTKKGIRIIQLQNIGDGYFIDNYKIFTSRKKADELISCNIYPNNIIISKMAEPLARACIIPNNVKRYVMASDGIRLSINKSNYDLFYVLYSINSSYFRKNAEIIGTGTTRLRIRLNDLRNLKILVPPLFEQQKIGSIISNLDNQININNIKVSKLFNLKTTLMQDLLTGKARVKV